MMMATPEEIITHELAQLIQVLDATPQMVLASTIAGAQPYQAGRHPVIQRILDGARKLQKEISQGLKIEASWEGLKQELEDGARLLGKNMAPILEGAKQRIGAAWEAWKVFSIAQTIAAAIIIGLIIRWKQK